MGPEIMQSMPHVCVCMCVLGHSCETDSTGIVLSKTSHHSYMFRILHTFSMQISQKRRHIATQTENSRGVLAIQLETIGSSSASIAVHFSTWHH